MTDDKASLITDRNHNNDVADAVSETGASSGSNAGEYVGCINENLSCYTWEDITGKLAEACTFLDLGQLVSGNDFTLTEAMSAIELMDPKMDAGMSPDNFAKMDFDKALKNKEIRLCSFTSLETVKIIDATFSTVVSWLEGHSVAQTVFTNLYLHNPYAIEDRFLRTFCFGVLKLMDICHDVLRRASVSEEEDFQQNMYDFDLASKVPHNRTIAALKAAEEECHKLSKTKGYDALCLRLRFIRHLIVSIVSLTVSGCEQQAKTIDQLPKMQTFEEAIKQLKNCEDILKKIGEEFLNSNDDASYALDKIMGFYPRVNQHLLPPTFIRNLNFEAPCAVYRYFLKLVNQMQLVCTLPDHVTNFDTVLDFFREFSRNENCVLSRSILQVALTPTNDTLLNKTPLIDSIKEAVRSFVNPPVLHPSVDLIDHPLCKCHVEEFFENCARIGDELLRIAGHNRSRQRDCYAVVLTDLANFQEAADRLDSHLHVMLNEPEEGVTAPPQLRHHMTRLGSYVLRHILGAMVEYLTLGFELELYSPHEYAYIFWYLNEFLFKWTVNVLHKVDALLYEQELYSNLQENDKSRTDKKKSKSKKKPLRTHRFEILRLQAYQKLCEAYHRAVMGFFAANRITAPSFSNLADLECFHYEHRLEPFLRLSTPPMVTYKQYLEISNFQQIVAKISSSRLFVDAAGCFEEARLAFETMPLQNEKENHDLMKLCKMNAVVLRLLSTGKQDGEKDWPRFDFSLHKAYPIIKLK